MSETPVGKWTSGLCGCCYDVHTCCWTLWCPCVQIGRNTELITDGETDCVTSACLWYSLQLLTAGACGWLPLWRVRATLRRRYALPGSACHDALATFCCWPCSVCQEARELKNRGWNPDHGYTRNMEVFQARGHAPPAQAMYK